MNNTSLASLLERDIDDIGKTAIALDRDDRRQTLALAAQMLHDRLGVLRAVKILGFVQAALSMERNGQFPASQARAMSTAVMKAASNTEAADVHRAAIDVMMLLSVKAYAERNNLRVMANNLRIMAKLMETPPPDPLGFAKEAARATPAPEQQRKTRVTKRELLGALKKKVRYVKQNGSARRKHGA